MPIFNILWKFELLRYRTVLILIVLSKIFEQNSVKSGPKYKTFHSKCRLRDSDDFVSASVFQHFQTTTKRDYFCKGHCRIYFPIMDIVISLEISNLPQQLYLKRLPTILKKCKTIVTQNYKRYHFSRASKDLKSHFNHSTSRAFISHSSNTCTHIDVSYIFV